MSETIFDKKGVSVTRYVGVEQADGSDRTRYQLTVHGANDELRHALAYVTNLTKDDIVEMATAVIKDDTQRKLRARMSEYERERLELEEQKRKFKAGQ